VGYVSSLNPTGNVTKGSTITVRVYGAYPIPSKPGIAQAPAGPHLAGDVVPISFPAYSGCPSNHPLQGYTFTLGNATFTSGGNPVSGSPVSITLGTAGTDATVSYVALCSDNITSAPSDQLPITVSGP
jgi:serine/threonine-protein kinase